MKPFRQLGAFGRVWRVVWLTAAGLVAVSLVQVLLGRWLNPPLTPLMVQRYVQQHADKDRAVRFERDYVRLDDISPNLVTAVVHSEDGLFPYHHGFDVAQMKKAVLERRRGKPLRGASTISQQTAKNAFLPHSRTHLRKAVEAYYTVLIEALWGKRRIMEVYLNIVEFGDGIYGCEAAAQHYFHHSAARLTRHEAAQLAATLPSPLRRNPERPDRRFARRTARVEASFRWGAVDLDQTREERRSRGGDRENLIQFLLWRLRLK